MLSDESKRKLSRLSQAKGMSQNEIVNLLIAAVDDAELLEIQTEWIRTGSVRPRTLTVQSSARWRIRIPEKGSGDAS